MAVGGAGGAAAAAAARAAAAAAEAARKAAEAAAKARAAAAAAAKAKAAAAAKAAATAAKKNKPPLHPKERPTKNRSAFSADLRAPKIDGPIRERATKNRSAFVSADHRPLSEKAKAAAKTELKTKTHDAEAQKTKAKDAYSNAQEAKKDANAAHEKAAASHDKVAEEKARLEKFKNKPITGPGGEHAADSHNAEVQRRQMKLNELETTAKGLDVDAKKADGVYETKRQSAIKEQDKVITTQQAANTAAKAAHEKEPYKEVEGITDARDLASQSPKVQEKILGTRAAVTPKEAGAADARRVEEAAKRSPEDGAEELQRQLKGNDDPGYRAELAKASKPAVDRILTDAAKSNDPAVADRTVKSLARSADAAGPEASSQFGKQIADKSNGEGLLQAAIGNNANSAVGRNLARDVAKGHRANGDYEKADGIAKLDPKLASTAAESTGESKAREAAQVRTVTDDRDAGESRRDVVNAEAKKHVADVQKEAREIQGMKPPPKNVRVSEVDGVTTIERLRQGKVIERTSAEQNEDTASYSTTTWDKKGTARRTEVTGSPTESLVQHASWKEDRSAAPTNPTSEELKNSTRSGFSVREEAYSTDSEGDFHTRQYSQSKDGISHTTQSFGEQDDKDGGLDDKFDDKFGGGTIQTVTTKTVQLPGPGQKGPDGKDARGVVTESKAFGQGDQRATWTKQKETDAISGQPKEADVALAQDHANLSEDEPDKAPKQWTLEVNKGENKMQAQKLIEGNPHYTEITTREAHGSRVDETIDSKFPDEDGKASETKSTKSTTFDDYGRVTKNHSDITDREGNRTVQDYSMERRATKRGIEFDENTKTVTTDSEGRINTQQKATQSLIDGDGPKLVGSQTKTTDAEGNVSEANVDGEKVTTIFNGRKLSPEDVDGLADNQKELVNASLVSQFEDLKRYQRYGNKGLDLVRRPLDAALKKSQVNSSIRNLSESETAAGNRVLALERQYGKGLIAANRAIGAAANGGKFAGGVLGVAASGISAANNFANGNIAAGLVDAVQTFSATPSAFTAAKGLNHARILQFGNADKVAGLSKSVNAGKFATLANGFADSGLGKVLTKFGGPAQVIGVATSAYGVYTAFSGQSTDGQKAQAVVGLVGGLGAIAVGAAVGSVAPVVGTLIGAGIGVLVVGTQVVIGAFADNEHELHDVEI